MSDKEKAILETFSKTLPDMTETERENLLSFGEGMAFMVNQRKKQEAEQKEAEQAAI